MRTNVLLLFWKTSQFYFSISSEHLHLYHLYRKTIFHLSGIWFFQRILENPLSQGKDSNLKLPSLLHNLNCPILSSITWYSPRLLWSHQHLLIVIHTEQKSDLYSTIKLTIYYFWYYSLWISIAYIDPSAEPKYAMLFSITGEDSTSLPVKYHYSIEDWHENHNKSLGVTIKVMKKQIEKLKISSNSHWNELYANRYINFFILTPSFVLFLKVKH